MKSLIACFALALVVAAGPGGTPALRATETYPYEGKKSLEWGPPLGWSSNAGDVCGDANDEDAGLACIHVGVPQGTRTIEFSGAVDVSRLDPKLQLVPGLFTLRSDFSEVYISDTTKFPGGKDGWQTFKLKGTVTKETDTSFLIPIFKVRVIGEPDNSFAGNDDGTSVIFIDALSLSFDGGENLLSNGGFEADGLSEDFSVFQNRKAWFPPNCVSKAAEAKAAIREQDAKPEAHDKHYTELRFHGHRGCEPDALAGTRTACQGNRKPV